LFGKPRIKTQPDADFYEVAKQKLEDMLQPEPERLNDLAIARANAISKYLLEKDGVDLSRQYILAPELTTGDTPDIVSVLSLNVAH
jgi:type II secretory pathway component PulL